MINGVKGFQALSKGQSDWRLARGNIVVGTGDVFADLVEAKDPETGNGLNEEQIVAETGSLLLAGSDIQATTLAAKRNVSCLRVFPIIFLTWCDSTIRYFMHGVCILRYLFDVYLSANALQTGPHVKSADRQTEKEEFLAVARHPASAALAWMAFNNGTR